MAPRAVTRPGRHRHWAFAGLANPAGHRENIFHFPTFFGLRLGGHVRKQLDRTKRMGGCGRFVPHSLLWALLCGVASAQLPPKMLNFQRIEVRDAVARGAVCNDGTPATYYFRDCPRPGPECATEPEQWLIIFSGGEPSDACFDEASCAARARRSPSSTSSKLNPATLDSPVGLFSTSGEANPNFYMHRAVIVPYCSSDMWLGNSSGAGPGGFVFRGRAIMRAVLEDVAARVWTPTSIPTKYGPGPNNTRLSNASQVMIAGKAGVMRWLDDLAALLPPKPRAGLRGICDGCVVVDTAPLVDVGSRPCGNDAATCPPQHVLQSGSKLWGLSLPGGGSDWKSLLAGPLLSSIRSPLLVQHPQYDRAQLTSNRAWPPKGKDAERYVKEWGAKVRALMKGRPDAGRFTFSVACSSNSTSFLLDHDDFHCRPAACVLSGSGTGGKPQNTTLQLTAVTSMFLKSYDKFQPSCVDTCQGVNCNPNCGNNPSCFG